MFNVRGFMNKRKRKKLLRKVRMKTPKEISRDFSDSFDTYKYLSQMYNGIKIIYPN